MQKFRDQFPDYESYTSDKLYYSELPDGFVDGFQGIVYRHTGNSTNRLKSAVNTVCSFIPESPTTNWGYDFLQNDFSSALYRLSKKEFHKFMDAILAIVEGIETTSFAEDLNEYFEEVKFGYFISESFGHFRWELANIDDASTQKMVAATLQTVKTVSAQAAQHIDQILENLSKGSVRADKDAVRDAMSAMEAFLKQITSETDLKAAVNKLRADEAKWGPSDITKDGISIWDRLHTLYPDIRHGNPVVTAIDKDSVFYWIERILVYVRYVARRI